MAEIRLVLASMPRLVLREIVREIADHRPDMEVVARDVDRSELHAVVREYKADVVIVGLDENELPRVCSDLLREFPDTLAVGVASDGKLTAFHALHVNNIGINELVETIRVARHGPDNRIDSVHRLEMRP